MSNPLSPRPISLRATSTNALTCRLALILADPDASWDAVTVAAAYQNYMIARDDTSDPSFAREAAIDALHLLGDRFTA